MNSSRAPSRTLRRALGFTGSKERLAAALKVSLEDLESYLTGGKDIPDDVFLAALDIVAGKTPGRNL
jgi:hypothetical protein